MTKEVEILKEKAENSLLLCIELFNRPWEKGRTDAVLMHLDHAFEMLLKSSILKLGGTIQKRGSNQTIGFQDCINACYHGEKIKLLSKDQVVVLQTINNLRDACQHYFLEINEQYLYLYTQAGFTLFREIYKKVFDQDLYSKLPQRVLPISTIAPIGIHTLFENDVKEIEKLLGTGKDEIAKSKIRTLLLIDNAIQGNNLQPTSKQILKTQEGIKAGEPSSKLFQGVTSIKISNDDGTPFNLYLSKKGDGPGTPVILVPEGTPGAHVVAVQKLKETSHFNMTFTQLLEKVDLNSYQLTAVIDQLNLKNDQDCCLKIPYNTMPIYKYSPKALEKINNAIKIMSIEKICRYYKQKRQQSE